MSSHGSFSPVNETAKMETITREPKIMAAFPAGERWNFGLPEDVDTFDGFFRVLDKLVPHFMQKKDP